jgi:tRNA modification GTPase
MEDTIAAISTPSGDGAIGIVRMSGEKAFEVIDKIFKNKSQKKLLNYENRQLIYGHIMDNDKVIDEVLVSLMKAPNTYTTEDIVEINCHGGSIPIRRVLELILTFDVRMADPGEFTKRAFLNGRLDLSQAESVMDLISAKTPKGFDVAYNQLEGNLSKKINIIKNDILDLMSRIEVSIDYPEEDIKDITHKEVLEILNKNRERIVKILKTSETGKIIKNGLSTVIIGKPNVGKSSLLNALLKEAKAIVTNIPGTTRDIIEEYININGIPLKIIDTAGIRETENEIEKIGVRKSKEFFNKADLVIVVLNNAEKISKEDREIIKYIEDKKVIVVINKTDLENKLDYDELNKLIKNKIILKTSITNEYGVEEVENEIAKMVYDGNIISKENEYITNIRQIKLLNNAFKSIESGVNATISEIGYDFIEVDIKDAYNYLSEITGEIIGEDVINKIFSQFCLGK